MIGYLKILYFTVVLDFELTHLEAQLPGITSTLKFLFLRLEHMSNGGVLIIFPM